MSAKMAQKTAEETIENQNGVEAAYEAVGEALQELSVVENREQWNELQKTYFDLKAAVMARDEEFQKVDLPGTRVYVPAYPVAIDNPTIDDELGEVEVPTLDKEFRVMDDIQVCDPDNPHVTHAVSIDHEIDQDGNVTVEVNADTLDELPGGN